MLDVLAGYGKGGSSVAELVLKEVSKTVGEQQLVEPLNLSCTSGQIVALCGGNGAGKSTIIRMIAGLTLQSKGKITIDGMSIQQSRQQYVQKIGYMPDDFQFTGGFTAYEALAFWGDLKGVPRARVLELLQEVGLQDTGKKKVQSFSKGMRQRLLLAQAILSRPAILLLDEPTNGLDPYWMKRFATMMTTAARNGSLVIFSTHQLQVAEAIADTIIFLHNGKVKLAGSYDDICAQYGEDGLQKAYAALFWGEEGPLQREKR